LKPYLKQESTEPINEAMFGWLNVIQRSIRTRQHKLIFYAPLKRYQLFDLANDPWEMHDLTDDPAYADVKKQMIARLKAEQQRLGDPLDIDADHPMLGNPQDL
jgi:choline-sulfatase